MPTELFACIIGTSERPRQLLFNLSHDDGKIRLVYPFWVLREPAGTVLLVDIGFPANVAEQRGIREYCDPLTLLKTLGIAAGDVKRVIVSHLHYDHFAAPERYPNAEFWIQRDDVDYYTQRAAVHPARRLADGRSLDALVALEHQGRLRLLDGDTQVNRGIRVVHVGGHSPGMQIVVCEQGHGSIVLACDASHFYENLETRTPTSIIHAYESYQRGFDAVLREATSGVWFPGHDPHMLERMAPVSNRIYRVTCD